MPLSQMITPPNPALESMLLATRTSHRASNHPQLPACPVLQMETSCGLERLQFTPGLWTVSPKAEHQHLYHFRAEKHLLVSGLYVCVCVCLHTHTSRVPLYDQCCNKHPCTQAFGQMPLFLWNRFPGVGLLGQRAYVFLILMDFFRLISKMAVIIYISTSNDLEHTSPPQHKIDVEALFNFASLEGANQYLITTLIYMPLNSKKFEHLSIQLDIFLL